MAEYLVQYFKADIASELLDAGDNRFCLQAESLEDALQEASTRLWDLERKIGADTFIAYARLQAVDKSWYEVDAHCDSNYKRAIEKMLAVDAKV
ncbi:hypothetical protein HZA98_02090 [Candidatus Woesearchaeota archaeon]|nr:hypothetical protein [Candidatus Woesearchaeota archaeon]